MKMGLDPVDPVHDSRISHCKANVNGKNYRETKLRLIKTEHVATVS